MRLGIVPKPRTVPLRENEMWTLPLSIMLATFEIHKRGVLRSSYHFDGYHSGIRNQDFPSKIDVGIVWYEVVRLDFHPSEFVKTCYSG